MSTHGPIPPNNLRSGDLLHVTRAASVQCINPIAFRVIRVLDWPTYDGWVWLEGYQLNAKGDAVARRSIFVQPAGLVITQRPPRQPPRQTLRGATHSRGVFKS
ncbi:hypothetical protein [Micromonospora rifamycinica]|uniref:Uncharacterized protein n=1 Tax=Micromonospora rifamycinica TaxID=291594 RepID=A0A1C5K788_9ACTN|nr:hypothetical protein [Micromonospora rifamycinica]SCG78570.1 hypothetical protein GA0070623_4426 [Micromonospora rifamycinica]